MYDFNRFLFVSLLIFGVVILGLGRKFRTSIYLERANFCFTALNARLRKFMTDGLQFVARTLPSTNRRLGGVLFFRNIGIVSAFESRQLARRRSH
jgi:hypothetical protein